MYKLDCYINNILAAIEFSRSNIKSFQSSYVPLEQKNIWLTGELNYIWNEWNLFWRYFWITIFNGSAGTIDSINIMQIASQNEGCVLNYAKFIHSPSQTKGFFNQITGINEKTWGDKDVICQIAAHLTLLNASTIQSQNSFFNSGFSPVQIESYLHNISNHILSIFGCYGTEVKRLQLLRNKTVHLSNESFLEIKNIISINYSFPTSNFSHPCDILFATSLTSDEFVFDMWLDEMKNVVEFL